MSKNYSINFNGNVNNIQLQQNTTDSKQDFNNTEIDYDLISKLLLEICNSKDKMVYNDLETENKFNKNLDIALEEVSTKKNPERLKKALSVVKDIFINASGGLIASGIFELVRNIIF